MNPIIRDFLTKHPNADLGSFAEVLVKFICPRDVVVGGVYRHFKGGLYKVLGFVRPSSDWPKIHVHYIALDDDQHEATRLLSEFLEDIPNIGPRFKYVGR